jgi:hypothetical protein
MSGMRLAYAVFLIAAAFLACSSSSSRSNFGSSGTSGDGSSSGTSGSFGGSSGTPSSSSGGNQAGCSDAAKLVYVVSEENDLYSFQPDKLVFTKIGTLDCPSLGGSPNSMAVDRSGTAWVNFDTGELFSVSTSTAKCTATTYKPGQQNFVKFGMAFATDAAGSENETLYVCGIVGQDQGLGLAKIDLKTMTLSKIGDFSGSLHGLGAELTGTGDGRLFGFFTTNPDATLAKIEEASGATSQNVDLAGVNTGNAWAFSFWGGDFWFYTSNGTVPSTVTRLRASSDNKIATAQQDVGGFRIVGAGVSTCAPTTPVK